VGYEKIYVRNQCGPSLCLWPRSLCHIRWLCLQDAVSLKRRPVVLVELDCYHHRLMMVEENMSKHVVDY
jgi:hypothetical protein